MPTPLSLVFLQDGRWAPWLPHYVTLKSQHVSEWASRAPLRRGKHAVPAATSSAPSPHGKALRGVCLAFGAGILAPTTGRRLIKAGTASMVARP